LIHFHGVPSAPSRIPLFSHHGFVSHVSRTVVGLPLLFIQKQDKTRRPSANKRIQTVIGCHKGGHVKIPRKKITHNNNIQTRNMNQLWHTKCASVLRQIHRELLGPAVFTARRSSSTFRTSYFRASMSKQVACIPYAWVSYLLISR
jgi:hypothetical protein